MAKPPFPWVGSKRKLLQFIFQLLPSDIQNYIEPFGGSGAVILEMRASSKRRDVYNDLNRNLTNFFVCLRDKTNALLRELKFLPIQSRWLFEVYKLFLAHEEIHWKVYEKNIREEIQILEDRTCFTEEQAEELRPIYDQKLENFDGCLLIRLKSTSILPQQSARNNAEPHILCVLFNAVPIRDGSFLCSNSLEIFYGP